MVFKATVMGSLDPQPHHVLCSALLGSGSLVEQVHLSEADAEPGGSPVSQPQVGPSPAL